MERQPVESSNLKSVGYDPQTQTLEIEFQHGGVYQYLGVPESIYNSLMSAPSLGSYFYHEIRDVYTFRQVNDKDQ